MDGGASGRGARAGGGSHRQRAVGGDGPVGRVEDPGERGPPEPYPRRLDRAHGGQRDPQALAPAGVEAALADQVASGCRVAGGQRHEAEGLGGAELVGQVGGQGAGAPVGRAVPAQHEVG